ncbi:Predicted transglutaminase-like cysteine proteinase [Devosia sp. YR412]|uniref:transglutaminase-like cysteine peptidase n=1 Tax=Devosia sp. YR412 TaxID=1881030 RepID=UPI0008D3A86B|nr:transglutaminase-like cysteine peptidase [Devosia sp. YR412]SEQ37493.1 Predicted transglutaminase-like cysteine proteinase [Devosia sp. YR412]
MIRIKALAASVALAVVSLSIGPVAAAPAPVGFQIMCLQFPAECQGGGSHKVLLTEAMLVQITHVNSQINRAIQPRNDAGADIWSVGVSSGDCEDYALSKRRALIEGGLPPSALRLAYVKTRTNQDHAILIIKTDTGDLVLDNLAGQVLPLGKTAYRIIAASGPDPMVWSR